MQTLKRILATVLCLLCVGAHAQDGVTAREIRIGMANALSGPAAGLGLQLRAGASAYFDRINAAGGVHGRLLTLVSVDDAYDPVQTIRATHTLIDVEKVFVLFGFVGTPTSAAAVPIAAKHGVPYLFPFTGAESLRNPVIPMVFNLRASYFDETESLVEHLTSALGARRIGLFIQNDEFGEAGKAGVLRALKKRKLRPAMEARYTRNTIDIGAGVAQLARTKPDAVVFIGTYRPLAALVKRARAAVVRMHFATVSFIGTSEFIKHAGRAGDGVTISQVMPPPDGGGNRFIERYHADVAPAARNYGSLEGYADAMVLVEALERSGSRPTRSLLLRMLEQLQMDMGDLKVEFNVARHEGTHRVFLTKIADGKAAPVENP